MADTKISALTAATAMADANEFAINEAGTSKKLTGTLIKAWIGDVLSNQSTATQNITAGVSAYLTGSNISVPVGKLRVGTIFKWRLSVVKTNAGTAANSIILRVGTNGTTADTAVLTFTTGTGTAAIDQALIEVDVVCRGPLSASGIFQGIMILTHELAITGFQNKATRIHQLTSATFNVTTANLIVGLSCTTAASTVLDFLQLSAEAKSL